VMALTIAITAVMLAQVFFRYVLNDSLQWSEEVSVWLMIWMTFIGGALLSANDEHMAVSMVLTRLPDALRPWFVVATKLLTLLFLGFVVFYGLKFFDASFHKVSPSTGLSTKWAKLALPVGSALMFLLTVNSLLLDAVAIRRGDRERFVPRTDVAID